MGKYSGKRFLLNPVLTSQVYKPSKVVIIIRTSTGKIIMSLSLNKENSLETNDLGGS